MSFSNSLYSVLVALDRAQRTPVDVIVARGLDIAGTTAIAFGGAKYQLARISKHKQEYILPEATTVPVRDTHRLDIVIDGAAVQVVYRKND